MSALGAVTYLIAPNRLHHLFVQEWQQAFPGALLHVAPSLETKREDLVIEAGTVCEVVDVGGVYLYLEPQDASKPETTNGPATAGEESESI